MMLPPVFVPECVGDDECPWDRSCVNQRCANPCVADHCSRGAFCHVENHKAVCRCPAGFQGDPLIECRPRKCFTIQYLLACVMNKSMFLF